MTHLRQWGLTRSRHGWVQIVYHALPATKSPTSYHRFGQDLWQLARFQLTRRIARSLGDSWASCSWGRDNDNITIITNITIAAISRTEWPTWRFRNRPNPERLSKKSRRQNQTLCRRECLVVMLSLPRKCNLYLLRLHLDGHGVDWGEPARHLSGGVAPCPLS